MSKAEIITRSTKNGEKLTAYERRFIEERMQCPDCEIGDLMEGPHGGMAVNCYCSNKDCGSKFNLTFLDSKTLLFADRISESQPEKSKT